MKRTIFFLLSIFIGNISGKDLHSLLVFSTYIKGNTRLPEFSAVLMLDDIKLGHYDSINRRFIYQKHGDREEALDDETLNDINDVLGETFDSMKVRTQLAKHRFNSTKGPLVQQRITGCELLDNPNQGQINIKEAFNAIDGGSLTLNNRQYSYDSQWPELVFNNLRAPIIHTLLQNVYLPICIKNLNMILQRKKHVVCRRERPKLRVIHKANKVSGGARVCCLATGFYPRFLNLSLLRNGHLVEEQQLSGGQVLPNVDGTYQMRKTLDISAQELRERYQYTCTASHLNQNNKLSISWAPESEQDKFPTILIILAVVLLVILLFSVAWIMWKFKCLRFSYSNV